MCCELVIVRGLRFVSRRGDELEAHVLGQVLGIAPFTAVAGSSDPYAGSGYLPYFVSQDQKIDPVAYPVATKG